MDGSNRRWRMYRFLNNQRTVRRSARDSIYDSFSNASNDGSQQCLYESAKKFFSQRQVIGSQQAFLESLHPSIKPSWLLWAVAPSISQSEQKAITSKIDVIPLPPPWSTK